MSVITNLDVEKFSQRQSTAQYPRVELVSLNETTPLVVSLLEQGSMSLLGCYKGEQRILGRISNSAYNVNKLLKTHGSLWYHRTEDDRKKITKIEDYLEAFTWILS